MTLEGFDCASSTVGHIPALKQAGMRFACRYLSTTGNAKNLTQAEAAALTAAGLGVVVVYETTANRALSGKAGGIADATSAKLQAAGVGMPSGRPIYFAVDFDATSAQESPIHAYIAGAASVLGHAATGVYGGYNVVKSCLDAGVCEWSWSTYAWSGGKWDPRTNIRQYENGATIGGLSVDRDRAMTADYGQWHPPSVKRLVGYTISYIDGHGHRQEVDVKQPILWLVKHAKVKNRGKVIISRRFRT